MFFKDDGEKLGMKSEIELFKILKRILKIQNKIVYSVRFCNFRPPLFVLLCQKSCGEHDCGKFH